ncbi:hypothetical protein [Pedobacter sp. NJ-S-72]
MKKSSIVLMIAGIVIMIVGSFIFGNLNYVNPVDAHVWTININGMESFPWVTFIGGLFFVLGIIFYISSKQEKGRRYH